MTATKRKAPAADQRLPYPDLESNEGKLFWLAAYFRDLSKALALSRLAKDAFTRKKTPEPVLDALITAQTHAQDEVRLSIDLVRRNGLLPYAHASTTIFDGQVAP